jgi:hypothetical protein
MFNRSEDVMEVSVPVDPGTYTEQWPGNRTLRVQNHLTVQVPPLYASVWLRVDE